MKLPVLYDSLTREQKREVRGEYVKLQNNLCFFCKRNLNSTPIEDVDIDWSLFPRGRGFLKYPIHLQHDHTMGYTEGAAHAYCNAKAWFLYGR